MKIEIANLPVEWQGESADFIRDFEAENGDSAVLTLTFEDDMPECHGIAYSDKPSANVLRHGGGEMLCADGDWRNATVYFTNKQGEYALPLAAMCSRFSFYNALLLHASCVDAGGKGIIFTGPSGIGKTTQAKLWQQHLGAEIINGDKIFLRDMNGFYACGLPWKGSSEFCLNRKIPLAGIVVLRQAEENRLTRLHSSAAEALMPNVFLPHWDRHCLDSALDTFEKLIKKIPVYLLECRPDKAAAELVRDTLLG